MCLVRLLRMNEQTPYDPGFGGGKALTDKVQRAPILLKITLAGGSDLVQPVGEQFSIK